VVPDSMRSEPLLDVPMVAVVAPAHPLAAYKGAIPKSELEKHV
jgi:DNA-binding transcriptional LysR family regulator